VYKTVTKIVRITERTRMVSEVLSFRRRCRRVLIKAWNSCIMSESWVKAIEM